MLRLCKQKVSGEVPRPIGIHFSNFVWIGAAVQEVLAEGVGPKYLGWTRLS